MMTVVALFLGVSLLSLTWYLVRSYERLQKVIYIQQDTIKRLINREPVTYQEVGKEAPEPKYERYSAWSGETIDIRDD
jgi:hypothetical protein